jgi:hypothetical protein
MPPVLPAWVEEVGRIAAVAGTLRGCVAHPRSREQRRRTRIHAERDIPRLRRSADSTVWWHRLPTAKPTRLPPTPRC